MILEVSEIFCSIQGESSYIGYPFILIRLSKCNLRCRYCDTKYAYKSGENRTISSIMNQIAEYPLERVEITGGEPLLQEETGKLIQALLDRNYEVLLETNGSQSIENIPDSVVKIIDVKTPGSGEENSFYRDNIDFINKQDNLKFVITDKNDFDWSKKFIKQYQLESKCEILFSTVKEELSYSTICEWILEEGVNVRFQPQLHKLIWPNQAKGV